MNKKVISTLIVFSLVFGIGVQAHAAPLTDDQQKQIQDNRDKYAEVKSKISDLTDKIDALDDQIQPLVVQIDKNNQQIKLVEKQIKTTQEEVDKARADLDQKEQVFGDRMRAIYKSGGQESYIAVILSSQNFSDFISKMEAVGKLMSLDKQIISDLKDQKQKLDDKVNELKTKNEQLAKLNESTQKQVDDLNTKKNDQLKLVADLKEQQKKVLGDLANSEVALIQYPASIIDNGDSSVNDLQNAIDMLRQVRTKVVSPDVDSKIVNYIEKAKKVADNKKAAATAQTFVSRGSSGSVPASSSSVLSEAYKYLGIPYVWGAGGPNSFDCSGFTSYVFGKLGVSLPRTTYDQINVGTSVSYSDLQPGDLVFTRGSASRPEHVGIYVGGGQMIHAPRTGENVKVGPIYDYVASRRLK
ncbi:C40 family peptidase [Clostridium manihotivorum]|uniref:Bacteriocin biosynthesis protein n=1 Tax=Clostridium manihotivorum TaxID=2320868 RepID=A0A410E144_9CLOT|nr:C40 family peptidase [Clostridium manihotivorum]QAA35023.1 bacteriocin biosynthesis protein [Clostridium manihotivorum]